MPRAEESPKKPKAAAKVTQEAAAKPKKAAEEKPQGDAGEFNPWSVLSYPHLAEKSMNMVEMENKLVFIVNKRATKDDIIDAVEKGFNVRVKSVRTEITMKGQKKAFIKLSPDFSATEIASRLGMI